MQMVNAKSCIERVFINLNAPPSFQLRQKILGDNNTNLQYIIQETKANVTLRGRGSGYIEQNGVESNEQLHLSIEHPVMKSLIEAKNLAKNLVETIQQDLQLFLQPNQQNVQSQQQQQQVQPPPIIQTSTQQISIPQAVLSCPPPTIIQNNALQPTHIIQQQSFIPQQQIIPHNVPMQIIQQTPINIPPPTGIPIRTNPIVQFQGQSLQPTNIQIQGANNGQQILLNQTPTQQYQLQYIPSVNTPQVQTIQHVLQPQQQIQGILQPGANGQQYITVQGNTAFMIPPPNIIQTQNHQNIGTVFNTPPTITLNPDDLKNDGKLKVDGNVDQKNNNQNLQPMAATRIVTNVPLNQPPPILNCPPPQIFNQQQQQPTQQQQIQFITNPWQQQQQQQQQQIQIVTQPQTIQSSGQMLTTLNSPQNVAGGSGSGQSYQQIQFHQATVTQPPPPTTTQIQTNHHQLQHHQPNMSFQQQFEQKINAGDTQQQQQRAGKRKFESETDADKTFPKMGVGQNMTEHATSSKIQKNRMMSNPPAINNHFIKMNNISTSSSAGKNNGDDITQRSVNNSNNTTTNKAMFNRNISNNNSSLNNQKSLATTTVESKLKKSIGKSDNDASDMNDQATNFTVMNNQSQQQMRGVGNNQNFRFSTSPSFVHQQPPPITQNSQFSGPRGQIMSNSSLGLYQNVGQNQMMQQPPPSVTTTTSHQFNQQDPPPNIYQQNNHQNFVVNTQQGSMNIRFNNPHQHQQQQQQQNDGHAAIMATNYQQQQQHQPRFRQW